MSSTDLSEVETRSILADHSKDQLIELLMIEMDNSKWLQDKLDRAEHLLIKYETESDNGTRTQYSTGSDQPVMGRRH